jgi:hypothetical protein
MILVTYRADGLIVRVDRDASFVNGRVMAGPGFPKLEAGFSWALIPEQDLAHLYRQDGGAVILAGRFPEDVIPADTASLHAMIDAETDRAIGASLHPFAARGEEAAIHREQLQAILDSFGMTPTKKFARLTEIASVAVADGKETKATVAKAG